ncbi:hypothetical protein PV11_05541 [Exophiala sideris]|uniref:SNF2 N-terminal domain-containing protein n=1 Tax=Exophiala sideris TaxID=1016849 RepID=A0A0D1X6W5_9EURO|nr:hypothetical protein PV11_05541 [Exophiala sideris]
MPGLKSCQRLVVMQQTVPLTAAGVASYTLIDRQQQRNATLGTRSIKDDLPHLRLYIYYESNPPKDKYAHYRIQPRDLAGYKGNGAKDDIRDRNIHGREAALCRRREDTYGGTDKADNLRYLFDHSEPQASRAVLPVSQPSFRHRAGIVVEDEDNKKNVHYLNQFSKVFHHVVLDEGHLAKNPATKLSKMIRLLEPVCFWILTGTPMPNEAIDYAGLMKVLWRNEWLQELLPC